MNKLWTAADKYAYSLCYKTYEPSNCKEFEDGTKMFSKILLSFTLKEIYVWLKD